MSIALIDGALKRGLNPRAHELGVYICGGRGQQSRQTPGELHAIAARMGLDGGALARTSRLTARIDNNARDFASFLLLEQLGLFGEFRHTHPSTSSS